MWVTGTTTSFVDSSRTKVPSPYESAFSEILRREGNNVPRLNFNPLVGERWITKFLQEALDEKTTLIEILHRDKLRTFKRHINPDGNLGGFVERGASVFPTSFVFSLAVVLSPAKLKEGENVSGMIVVEGTHGHSNGSSNQK